MWVQVRGGKARVHWRYTPDSYDEWVDASMVRGAGWEVPGLACSLPLEELGTPSLLPPHAGLRPGAPSATILLSHTSPPPNPHQPFPLAGGRRQACP